MMRFLLLLFLLFYPAATLAKAIELRSDNFILSGELREKDGRTLLRDLELFRKNIFVVLGVPQRPEVVPVQVYVTKNDKGLKEIAGVGGFGGMYTMTHNGPSFVLNGKSGFRRGGNARHVALHEYSHHIVAAYTSRNHPLWYNEGFANFLATFTFHKGRFRIGEPYDPYAYALSSKDWMPMTVVLASVYDYPFNIGDTSKVGRQTSAKFYAQTWLATHYLRNHDDHKHKLSDYIARMNKGEESLKAFKASFDMTPEEFEVKLKAYFKKNKFSVVDFTTSDQDFGTLKFRELGPQEAEMAKLKSMRSFAFNPARGKAVIAAVEKYEAEFGQSAQSLSIKADVTATFAKGKEAYEAAKAHALKALELEPDNIEANNIAALTMVHQHIRGFGGSEKDMKQARKYLAKVLRHDTQIPLANYSFALSYKDNYNPPDNALNAAGYALEYYRDKSFMGSNLGLAGILLNGEKFDEALPPINYAKVWSRDPQMRMAAQSMLRYIEEENR